MDWPGGASLAWLINDPVDGKGWSSGQLDRVRRLLPHVGQAVRRDLEREYFQDYYHRDERVPRLRRAPERHVFHVRARGDRGHGRSCSPRRN